MDQESEGHRFFLLWLTARPNETTQLEEVHTMHTHVAIIHMCLKTEEYFLYIHMDYYHNIRYD